MQPAAQYEEAVRLRQKHICPALVPYYKKPVMIVRGKQQYLYDHENRQYLDLIGGIVTVSVGHCHPSVIGHAIER